MSVSVTLNGTSYTIPQSGETGWGSAVTSWIQAVSNGTLQKTGGSFSLTAEADFGATYGLKLAYIKSQGTVSTTGILRLANAESVAWRNAANSADLLLKVNASNQLEFAGNPITGAAALTANKAVVTGASGVLATSATSDTEIGYVTGVTSAIQTQINTKITSGGGAIVNADVNSAAAIARSKLASGTNYRILANSSAGVMSENAALTAAQNVYVDANGQLSSEATVAKSRGGSGQDNSSLTFPATGTLATLAGSETLTNKVLSGNTATTLVSGAATVTLPTTTGTLATLANAETLTNKTLTGNTAVNLVSGAATVTLPTTTGTLATLANAETLSNKTLTTPVIDVISATDQSGTPATPSSGTTKLYSKTDGKVYKLTSSGAEVEIGSGSGGGINYVTNPDFESATTGYAAYADAAAASPVDGTGGAPTVTITRSTSSPLRGVGSGVITKDAANRQGEGVGYAFTISSADQAKVIQVSFDYAIGSGTFAGGTDAAVGDLVLYIYDVTNATLIQPSGYKVVGSVSGQFYKHLAIFQTASNSTSYRLIWHVATTSASAWTFKFDNVQCGPQVTNYGAPITDLVAYTPTFSAGWGTVTAINIKSRRIGDSLHVFGNFTAGTVAASIATMTLGYNGVNANVTIDSTKAPASQWLGGGGSNTTPSTTYFGAISVLSGGAVSTVNFGYQSSVNAATANANGSSLVTNGAYVSLEFIVPISGWGSSVVMSNDTDTRIVAFSASPGNAGGASVSSTAIAKFAASAVDTHGGYNSTTGLYTVPVSGIYSVSALLDISAATVTTSQYFTGQIQLNGSTTHQSFFYASATGVTEYKGSMPAVLLNCKAGDTIALAASSTFTTPVFANGLSGNYLSIQRLSGPSAIAATEYISARYTRGTLLTVANSGETRFDFATKSFDTHSAVTTGGSWVFTAPAPGKYSVKYSFVFTSSTYAVGNRIYIALYKNGVTYSSPILFSAQAAVATRVGACGADEIQLNAGDTIYLALANNRTAGSTDIENDVTENYVVISRVGI